MFWDNLKHGRDCIEIIPKERWDWKKYKNRLSEATGKTISKWGGFIEGVDKFDSLFFTISPKEAEFMDPQERLFLQTAWTTMEDAGLTTERLKQTYNNRLGVFVGVMWSEYQLYGIQRSEKSPALSLGSSYASIANRVSYVFNARGPSMTVDTMCSSSLTAIHLACESIKRGECSLALAGGVNLSIHPNKYIGLWQSGFNTSDGRCRSFGEGGDG